MKGFNLSKTEIINRIGYFRNKKKISAYDLGLSLGHSKNYFYRIESGAINLTIETLLETLEILDVSTSEFFYSKPEEFEEDYSILEKINSLSDKEKNSITTLLNIKK